MVVHAALLALATLATTHAADAEEPGTAAAAAPAPTAPAPSADREAPSMPEGRVLNGHVFMPSASVPGALTTTSFATYLQVADGSSNGTLHLGKQTFSGSFDYAGVGAIIGYEYAFLRYFSARLLISEFVFSGINGSSALAIGSTLQAGGTLGLTASLPVGDSLRVGILFDAGVQPGLALTIADGLKTVIDACNAGDCRVDTTTIFGKNNATTIQPALAANWAPWSAIGFTGNVAYTFISQHRNSGTFSGQAVTLAGAADFDFHAISRTPIGLQLVVNWTAPVNGSGLKHVTDLGGGIFYTGREHLALGVQLVNRRFAITPDVDVSWSTWLSVIGLRYYW